MAEAQKLVQGDDFDFLPRIGEGYHVLRRYSREFLSVLKLRAAPAGQEVLATVEYSQRFWPMPSTWDCSRWRSAARA